MSTYIYSNNNLIATSGFQAIDNVLSDSSINPVQGRIIKQALDNKQNVLNYDINPISGSNNILTSGSIYNALANQKIELNYDTEPIQGSSNIVNSGVIYTTVNQLQANFQAGCDSIVGALTAKGVTPTSNNLYDITNSINNISIGIDLFPSPSNPPKVSVLNWIKFAQNNNSSLSVIYTIRSQSNLGYTQIDENQIPSNSDNKKYATYKSQLIANPSLITYQSDAELFDITMFTNSSILTNTDISKYIRYININFNASILKSDIYSEINDSIIKSQMPYAKTLTGNFSPFAYNVNSIQKINLSNIFFDNINCHLNFGYCRSLKSLYFTNIKNNSYVNILACYNLENMTFINCNLLTYNGIYKLNMINGSSLQNAYQKLDTFLFKNCNFNLGGGYSYDSLIFLDYRYSNHSFDYSPKNISFINCNFYNLTSSIIGIYDNYLNSNSPYININFSNSNFYNRRDFNFVGGGYNKGIASLNFYNTKIFADKIDDNKAPQFYNLKAKDYIDLRKIQSSYQNFKNINNCTGMFAWTNTNLFYFSYEDWDFSKVFNVNNMFYYFKANELELSKFNFNFSFLAQQNRYCLDYMFTGLEVNYLNASGLNFAALLENMSYNQYFLGDFFGCKHINLSNAILPSRIAGTYSSYGGSTLSITNISRYDNKNILLNRLFTESFNITNMDISRRSNLYGLFSNEFKLKYIYGINTLDTSKIISLESMFFECENIISLDLSGWDIGNVTSAPAMFYNCRNLTTIYYNPSKINLNSYLDESEAAASAFKNCTNLVGPGGGYDSSLTTLNSITVARYFTPKYD